MKTKPDILKEVVCKSISPSLGVAVLACPTGSGKTHNIASVISEELIQKGEEHRRVFIVSPQLKLISDLLSKIRTNCAKHECNARILEIRSRSQHWMAFFSNEKNVENLKRLIMNNVHDKDTLAQIFKLINSLTEKYKFYSLRRSLDRSKLMEDDETLQNDQSDLSSHIRYYFIKKFYDDKRATLDLVKGKGLSSASEKQDNWKNTNPTRDDEKDKVDNDSSFTIVKAKETEDANDTPLYLLPQGAHHISEKGYELFCQLVEREYPFLVELYPELTIYRHDVVALTVAKLHQCNTAGYFYGGRMPFWNHITTNSLVIIDESDLSKTYALDTILSERLNQYNVKDKMLLAYRLIHNIDLLDTCFLGEFDKELAIWRDDLKIGLQKIINRFQNKMRIHSKLDGTRNFDLAQGGAIYHDRDSIFSSSSEAYVEFDDATDTDFLCTADEESADCYKLTYVDASLNIFLSQISQAIKDRLENYMHLNEQALNRISKGKPSAYRFSDSVSFRQILRHFQIQDDKDVDFLFNLKRRYYSTRTSDEEEPVKGNSIYNKGITITEVNSINADPRHCNLDSCKVDVFPENVIVELVRFKGCMVLLSSATADSKDPIQNYDHQYFENELGEFYYGTKLIDRKTKEQLKEFFDEHSAHPDVDFSIIDDTLVSSAEKTDETLFQLLGNSSALTEVEGFIASNKYMDFDIVTLLSNYRDFIADENAHGGLYFTPYTWPRKFLPENGLDDIFGAERIVKIFAQLRKKVFREDSLSLERAEDSTMVFPELNVAFLSGSSFEKDLSKVLEILSEDNNGKMLCFVAFGSGSVGVNYQYKVDLSAGEFCTAQKMRKDNKCNMDWIYIQHPTNYISGDDDAPISYVRGAIQMSILDEAMQISKDEKTRYVIDFLRRKLQNINYSNIKEYRNMIPVIKKNIHQTPAYREFCVAKIMQSLGRITRTPISRTKITVRMDSKCAQAIGANRVLEATTWLYRYIRGKCPKKTEKQILNEEKRVQEMKLDSANREINVELTRIARGARRRLEDNTNPEVQATILAQRDFLERMNKQVLKYPVLDTLDDVPEELCGLYYDTLEFPLADTIHPADAVYLETLCKEESMENYFRQEGFETRKRSGRYFLHTSVLQQLYTGRIGEYGVLALLLTHGIHLEQLPQEIYEEADWCIFANGHSVFIDVKFWAETIRERDTRLDDWARKIKRCNGTYIIVNLPLMKNIDSIRQRTTFSENAPALINGLIDIKTGKLVTKNLDLLVKIINKALGEQ